MKVARPFLVKTIFLAVACCGLLSGCAVVAPLLTVGGMAGLAPLQYASIAYTVGEYSYEYAANDRTPDEVIKHKIDSVVSGEAFELPSYLGGEPAGPEPAVAVAENKPRDPTLYQEARQKRIEELLEHRHLQFQRLEVRRMAFLETRKEPTLSLSHTAMVSKPDLAQGAADEVSLD